MTELERLELEALKLTGMAAVYAQYNDWKRLEAAILKVLTETAQHKGQRMTNDERGLLLTVARILRAKVRNEIYAEQEDDFWALCEALKPFDPSDAEPTNEQAISGRPTA